MSERVGECERLRIYGEGVGSLCSSILLSTFAQILVHTNL